MTARDRSDDDPLAPARGVWFGVLLALPLWAVLVVALAWVLTPTGAAR